MKHLTSLMLACMLSISTLSAQKVTATWSLTDPDHLDAVDLNIAADYASLVTTSLVKGSGLTVSGTMTSSGADDGYTAIPYDPPFTKFTAGSTSASRVSTQYITFRITVPSGHTFKPTAVSFDAAHTGTDKGTVDLDIKAGDAAQVTLASQLVPLRNKVQSGNPTASSSYRYTVADVLVEGGTFTATVFAYNIPSGKEISLRNLSIEGVVDEPVYDFSHYVTALTCSAGDLYDLVKNASNGASVAFEPKLDAEPTDFVVTPAAGYEATVTYANQSARVVVTEGGEEVFRVTVRFSLSSHGIHHGTATPLNRGLAPLWTGSGVFVSWRKRATDEGGTAYNLYRDGELVKGSPFTTKTNVLDASGTPESKYSLEVVKRNEVVERQDNIPTWDSYHMYIKLQTPQDSRGLGATYTPNDCSAYDMDGDGEYEIIVKWDPSNSKDSAGSGKTSDVIIDCYKLDGTLLWRINLGQNIRAGAHYTTFLCYDFDGDGFGEMMVKTAPGTVDGLGNYVIKDGADPTVSYVNGSGKIASGPEWVSVFDGTTGQVLGTADYYPKYGDEEYGDSKMNRSDRFKACVAFFGGRDANPSGYFTRGYYAQNYGAAYDWDGVELKERWRHAFRTKGVGLYGEGAHSLAVGDVDGDGRDEVFIGSAMMDDDGTCLWRSGLGHGDATHLGDFDWDNPGMEVAMVYEDDMTTNMTLRDAATGKLLWRDPKSNTADTGRGLILNCDALHDGAESMHSNGPSLFDAKGRVICPWQEGTVSSSSINYRIYWDGDLLDEYHDRQHIDKWNSTSQSWGRLITLYSVGAGASSINDSKNNPNLQCDLFGDWREEVVYWCTVDGQQALHIICTTTPTDFALPTLRDDHEYDMAIAWQNTGYNQPPHLSYDPIIYLTEEVAPADGYRWAPYCPNGKVVCPPDVEAYIVRGYSRMGTADTVRLVKVESDVLASGQPVLLRVPDDGRKLAFRPSEQNMAVNVSGNYLRGVAYADTVKSDPEGTTSGEFFYEFRKDPVLGYGFFLIPATGVVMPDRTCYLRVKDSSSFTHAPYYLLGSEEQSGTAIKTLRSDARPDAGACYDLTGRRARATVGGFYIQDGQKVIIR